MFKSKFLVLFYAIILSLSLSKSYGQLSGKPILTEELVKSASFQELNQTLDFFQKEIKKVYGVDKIYIGGGSSRAILDHIYFNKPLEMRDLDVFIVANKPVDSDYVNSIGKSLEGQELGRFSSENLRPRPRANPLLPLPERNKYNAGYGFFFKKEKAGKEIIFDLSVYHSVDDLNLNGIVDFDKVMIPLSSGEDLEDWAKSLKTGKALTPIKELKKTEKILDPQNGYVSWTEKKFTIANWANFEADPSQVAIRIARSLGKIGITEIPAEEARRMAKTLAGEKSSSNLQFVRNLLKLMEDSSAAEELKMLASINAFENVSPALQLKLQGSTVADIKEKLSRATNFYGGMTNAPPKEVQTLLTLIDDLPLSEKAIFVKELAQPALFPAYFEPLQKELTKVMSNKRIGFYSGVFNPVHHGHVEVAELAIKNLGLDEIYIIPTPATSHNEIPIDLKHRREMIKMIAKRNPKVKIIPDELVPLLEKSTGDGIEGLIKSVESKLESRPSWFHIMGSDSYLRFRNNKERLESLRTNQSRNVYVVQRAGETVETLSDDIYHKTHFASPKTQNGVHSEIRSSSLIRKKLASGESITGLVLPEVEEYIVKNQLFLNVNPALGKCLRQKFKVFLQTSSP